MKVLHVIASADPRHGGVSEGLRQLAEVSMELGCEIEVLSLDRPGQPFLDEFPCRVNALGPGLSRFHYNPALLRWLLAHIREYEIVVIHALWQYHSVAVRQAALKCKVPYVVYTHGMLDPYFKHAHPLKHARKWLFWPWADYPVLRDASAVLFTTDEERLLASQSFWLYSAKERVVNLGTARPTGSPELQRKAFYRKFPQLNGSRQALFLGRIHQKKGCDLAIQSFARVLAADPTWRLVMAGPDQTGWRTDLISQASLLGIADRITWTGMLSGDEKWGALHAAEFFFLPSHQENFGVAVAEALAVGLPVLISDKVNIWREVKSCDAGLVAHDTLDGAVSLLKEWLALGDSGRKRLRANTVSCFDQKFEIHHATQNLLDILNTIVPAAAHSHAYVNA